jgi:hypothetical protein
LLLIASALLFSCKKKDTDTPVIIINSPYENQSFTVFDSISVSAIITDNLQITSIDMVLTDENFVPVLKTYSYYPNKSYFELRTSYILDDINLPSGNYYLLIKASDGNNSKNRYVKLLINETPKRLKYIAVITKSGSTINISKVDSAFNISTLKTVTSDYCGSAVNSRYQQLYLAGSIINDIKVYSLPDMQIKWAVQSMPDPPTPYFENIYLDNNNLFVSFRQNKFNVYNQDGSSISSTVLNNGMVISQFMQSQSYLVTEQYQIPLGVRKISIYYPLSYSLFQELNIDFEVVDFFTKNNDNIYITANKNGQGILKIYNIPTNGLWQPLNIPAGKIYSSCQINNNDLLISKTNEILLYQYSNTNLVTFRSGINGYKIKKEELSNTIFACDDKNIYIFTYPNGGLVNTININDSILDFHFVYNKE